MTIGPFILISYILNIYSSLKHIKRLMANIWATLLNHACVHESKLLWRPEAKLRCQEPSTLFTEARSLTEIQSLPVRLGWLVNEPLGSSCLCWYWNHTCSLPCLILWVNIGHHMKLLILRGKHFTKPSLPHNPRDTCLLQKPQTGLSWY